jgi:hypothetical protein
MTNDHDHIADMHTNLTDPLYQEMIDNPDAAPPYLINWTAVEIELAFP